MIVYNLPEIGESEQDTKDNDTATINKMIEEVAPDRNLNVDNSTHGVFRLGKKIEGKHRPIKVLFRDGCGLKKVMRGKDEGKLMNWTRAKFSPDRTQKEREEYHILVQKLIERKEKGEQDLVIRDMKIVSKASADGTRGAHTGGTSSASH